MLNKITAFFKEVRLEMRKVNWPTKRETLKYTLLVIGVSLAIAAFLGGIDFIFTAVLNKFLL